jgi:glc operon protein GlcG
LRARILVFAAACAAVAAQPLRAAEGALGEQKTITSTGARALVDSCLAYAQRNNQAVGIAVVDPYGNLIDYHTMSGTNVIAGESAILKAKTAVRWWRSTEELNARVLGEQNVAPVWIGDFPQRGGVPIVVGGVVVGGMGIGGGGGDDCAKAASAAVLPGATTTVPGQ